MSSEKDKYKLKLIDPTKFSTEEAFELFPSMR